MILTLLIIFLLYKLFESDTYAEEVMCDYDIAERRHEENLEAINKQTRKLEELYEKKELERCERKSKKVAQRRFIKQGDIILGEELMEEYFE